MSVMLYYGILCVVLLMYLFVLCVLCLYRNMFGCDCYFVIECYVKCGVG